MTYKNDRKWTGNGLFKKSLLFSDHQESLWELLRLLNGLLTNLVLYATVAVKKSDWINLAPPINSSEVWDINESTYRWTSSPSMETQNLEFSSRAVWFGHFYLFKIIKTRIIMINFINNVKIIKYRGPHRCQIIKFQNSANLGRLLPYYEWKIPFFEIFGVLGNKFETNFLFSFLIILCKKYKIYIYLIFCIF